MPKKISDYARKVLVKGGAPSHNTDKRIFVQKIREEGRSKQKYKTIRPYGVISRKKPETPEQLTRRSMHYSIVEGSFISAGSSIINAFLVPFALFLRASASQIGLMSSAQQLASTFGQIPGAKLTDRYSRKSIWLFAQVIAKIALWVPIVLLPFMKLGDPMFWLIVFTSLSAFVIGMRTPAWTSLIGDIVPENVRGRYFGRRNAILGAVGIAATLAGGYVLTLYGFPAIFLLFIVLSIVAIPFFMRQYEPPRRKVFHYRHRISINPGKWKHSLKSNRPMALFTLYMLLTNFFIEMVAPFYSVYMLRELGFSYTTFSVLVVLGVVARIISFRYWGRLNDRFGSRKIFIVCAFLGVFVPFWWMWVSGPVSAAIVQIYDGLIFSGIDLVAFNYLLDVTPAERRPQYVANYNFFIGIGAMFGGLTGAFLATVVEGQTFLLFGGLQLIFMASFLLRLCGLSLLPKVSEIRVSQLSVPVRYVFWQAVAVEPMKGVSHAVHYTFHYPYSIESEFRREIQKIKYKIRMKRS
jgi:MFS family permease